MRCGNVMSEPWLPVTAGRIAAYELTNEPNICIPGEKYAEYVKIAGRAIREAAPGTIVVGGGITSDFGGSAGGIPESTRGIKGIGGL